MTIIDCCEFLSNSGMIVKKGTSERVSAAEILNGYNGELYPILLKMDEVCFYLCLNGKLIDEMKKYEFFTKRDIAIYFYKTNIKVQDCFDNFFHGLYMQGCRNNDQARERI